MGMARRLAARYDAAQTTDENTRHWANADALSADAALSPVVRRTLRIRSRYECANNTYAKGVAKTLADDLIGTAPHLQMATENPDWNQAIEDSWNEWCDESFFARKLRTMRQTKYRDGEAFATFINNPPLDHPVKLDLRLYEAEQIASPLFDTTNPDSLADGILFDDFKNVAAYCVLKYHPGDSRYTGSPLDFETIPARLMIHWFDQDRPAQHRGCVECAAGLPLLGQMRRYTLATIAAAETAADVAAFMETQQSPEDPEDWEPLDAVDFEKRMLMTLPRGWKMSQLKAEQPVNTYPGFKREVINEYGRERGVPYNVAAGDSSSYNYASGRLDHQKYNRSQKVERHDGELLVVNKTFKAWWAEARLADPRIPAELRGLRKPPPHSWNWDGDDEVDPQKTANGEQTKLRSGTTSRRRAYARQGLDITEEDKAAADDYGVPVEEYKRALFNATFNVAQPQQAPDQPDEPPGRPAP